MQCNVHEWSNIVGGMAVGVPRKYIDIHIFFLRKHHLTEMVCLSPSCLSVLVMSRCLVG